MENPFGSRPRIFVVDDELDIAKLLVVMLQMNQFDAIPFSEPLAVVDAAKATPPDYLISDILMPGMNGIELAIAVKREAPECKVLLFSGQIGASELIKGATATECNFEVLHKPIHPRELIEALRKL